MQQVIALGNIKKFFQNFEGKKLNRLEKRLLQGFYVNNMFELEENTEKKMTQTFPLDPDLKGSMIDQDFESDKI